MSALTILSTWLIQFDTTVLNVDDLYILTTRIFISANTQFKHRIRLSLNCRILQNWKIWRLQRGLLSVHHTETNLLASWNWSPENESTHQLLNVNQDPAAARRISVNLAISTSVLCPPEGSENLYNLIVKYLYKATSCTALLDLCTLQEWQNVLS